MIRVIWVAVVRASRFTRRSECLSVKDIGIIRLLCLSKSPELLGIFIKVIRVIGLFKPSRRTLVCQRASSKRVGWLHSLGLLTIARLTYYRVITVALGVMTCKKAKARGNLFFIRLLIAWLLL
jgi:hypothetical protein